MTEFLHGLHSGLRYLVLLAALTTIIVAAIGWLRGAGSRSPSGIERPVMGTFVGLLDLQVLIGVILLFVWPFQGMLIGHITMMILAAAAAHAGSIMARRASVPRSASGIRLAAAAITLVLIVGGILAIQRPVL